MRRDEFLEQIEEGIRTEESATALYLKHLDAVVKRSGRPESEVAAMEGIIDFLVAANKRHRAMLEGIRSQVMKEDLNVY